MRTSLVNGILYAFVVGAAVSASAVVFLVAVEAREGMGMAGFIGSLLLFPVTWVLGPVLMASGGDSSLMPLLAFSLAVAVPPILATWLARRSNRPQADHRERPDREVSDQQPAIGPHPLPSVESTARAYPLAPPPPVPPRKLSTPGPMRPPLPPVYGPPAPPPMSTSAMAPPMGGPMPPPATPSAAS